MGAEKKSLFVFLLVNLCFIQVLASQHFCRPEWLLQHKANKDSQLLLVTGDVQDGSASILIQSMGKDLDLVVCPLRLEEERPAFVLEKIESTDGGFPLTLLSKEKPDLIVVRGLSSDSLYRVYFVYVIDDSVFIDFVQFQTHNSIDSAIILSCDRSAEDNDFAFLNELALEVLSSHDSFDRWILAGEAKEKRDFVVWDLFVHLGDQIYADSVYTRFTPSSQDLTSVCSIKAHEAALQGFREFYQKTWNTSHWQQVMISLSYICCSA